MLLYSLDNITLRACGGGDVGGTEMCLEWNEYVEPGYCNDFEESGIFKLMMSFAKLL